MMPALENCVALSEPVGPTRLVGIITHKKRQTDFIFLQARTTDPGVPAPVGLVESTGGTPYLRWNRICDRATTYWSLGRAMLTPKHWPLGQGVSARERGA